ncbi:hypothetical protein ABZZ17_10345 [Streptomyces sp. NPDC006512]|uniref:hypothetical protein n=1 Tax=Streptomyces sp. NPDC006512 TaxID=3154307 RepID=UPI0033B9E9CE
MTRTPRRSPAAPPLRAAALPAAVTAVLAAALAVGGCAAPGGLAAGEPAPPVSAQPRPEPLWPAWAGKSPQAPGAATATRMPPPAPLPNGPEVGPGGITALNALDVVRADKRMRQFLGKGRINAPGGAGVRPAAYADLTGDGGKELVVAADTESGRTALSVYVARGKRVVPVLFTLGRRMAAESVGQDLLIRTAADDGSEQAVRYRWDGERMTVVSDERRFNKSLPGPASGSPAPSHDAAAGRDAR